MFVSGMKEGLYGEEVFMSVFHEMDYSKFIKETPKYTMTTCTTLVPTEEIETRLVQRFSQLESDLRKEQLTCKIKFAVLICGLFALQWMFL